MSVERVDRFLGSSLLIWGDSLLWRDALIDKPKAPLRFGGLPSNAALLFWKVFCQQFCIYCFEDG
jgi:hypothetical protein